MDDASPSVSGDDHRDHEARELGGPGGNTAMENPVDDNSIVDAESDLPASHDAEAVEQPTTPLYDVASERVFDDQSGAADVYSSRVRKVVKGMGMLLALVVAGGIAVGAFVDVAYIGLMPGSARDTEPLLAVEGIDEFPSDGTFLFTTVQMRQRPNVWEYLWLRADRDVEVVPEELILNGRTPEENRSQNLEFMDQSKEIAVAVALERLGYDAVQSDSVIVVNTTEGDPADGLLMPQDLIVAIDGVSIPSTNMLREVLAGYEPGDEIKMEVRRAAEDQAEVVPLVLGEHPEIPGGSFIGITPVDNLMFNETFDFDVEIDSGSVGGPSAGLAFTLAVLDQLTEGELTGGADVAVTGTIDVIGNVGSVGGVVQKTAAVRDMGADVFLVPADLGGVSLEDLEDRAGDDLRIMPVATIEEALAALEEIGGNVGAVDEFAASLQGDGETGQ